MVCRAGRCPSADALQDYEPRQTSKLYAADGRFIAELGLERRTLVKIADIPPLVQNAFVVDRGQALLPARRHRLEARSARRRRRHQEPQLQRRLLDDHDAAGAQHLPRAHLARQDARSASSRKRRSPARSRRSTPKDKILELYLNQINLGNGAYGVETRGAALLRQDRQGSERRRSRDAGRACPRVRSATIRASFPTAPCSGATRSSG